MSLAIVLAALLSAPAAAETPAPAPAVGSAAAVDAPRQEAGVPTEAAALLASVDHAWTRRDEPGAMDEIRAKLDLAERQAPEAYGVLWRQARYWFWLADDPALPDEKRSGYGKKAWDYGDRATRADPAGIEGWHYAAAGVGNYALGIGVFTALTQGIEGKFKDRLKHAESIDPHYQNGGIATAWGRYWFELPWPKYDAKKSEAALKAALARNPENVRAWVYLADLYRKEGKKREAGEALASAIQNEPGRYDAPEERRWQAVARRQLAAP